jgi:hypothetical protein
MHAVPPRHAFHSSGRYLYKHVCCLPQWSVLSEGARIDELFFMSCWPVLHGHRCLKSGSVHRLPYWHLLDRCWFDNVQFLSRGNVFEYVQFNHTRRLHQMPPRNIFARFGSHYHISLHPMSSGYLLCTGRRLLSLGLHCMPRRNVLHIHYRSVIVGRVQALSFRPYSAITSPD